MFKILQRYVGSSVASSAGVAILFIGFLFGAVNLLKDVLLYLLDGRIPIGLFLNLCWQMAQYVATYAVPIGVLIGALLVLGRMSADNEITAMRASGRGILQIARPILVLALIGVVAEFGVNFYMMPRARIVYHEQLEKALRDTASSFFVPRTFMRDIPGVIVFFDKKDGNAYHNLWVWKLDEQKRATKIYHATSAVVDFDVESQVISLTSASGTVESRRDSAPEKPSGAHDIIEIGGSEKIGLPLGGMLGKRGFNRKVDWMTLPELLAEKKARDADPDSDAVKRLQITLTIQQKLTFSLAVFSLALIAIPLGIRTSRKESSANIGIALLLVVVYYVMSISVGWLDRRPDLHPEILIWLPNALFIAAGLWLLRRVERA